MPLTPTRYTARWVLPVSAPPIPDGAVLVDENGTIAAVGAADQVPVGSANRDIALGDVVLLPGLVNVHAHPELTVFRGLIEDLPFPDWVARLQQTKARAALSPEDWRVSARLGLFEAAAAGITTVAATEDSGASARALADVGLRGVVYQEVFGPAPEQAEAALVDLRTRVDALRAFESDLVRVGVSPHAPFTVSDALFEGTASFALAEGLPVAVHVAESRAESLLVRRGSGPFADRLSARGIDIEPRAASTVALLERLGVLETRPLLIHCVRVRAPDIARIAAHGASVAHCPIANARLGHGLAPLEAMSAAAIRIGLGTDSVASNNRMDLFEEARAAHLMARARGRSPVALAADSLLRLVTIGGARVLGLDDRIGSLEPGKDADLCAIGLNAPHMRPVHDPVVALFHSARASDVVFTAVRGAPVYRAGDICDVDAERVDTIAERVAQAAL